MTRSTFIVLLSLALSQAVAQTPNDFTTYAPGQFEKPFDKLDKLYSKGKYDAVLTKASKLKSKNPRAAEPDYITSIVQYELAMDAPSSTKRDQLAKQALSSWGRAAKKDFNKRLVHTDTLFSNSLRELHTDLALDYYDDGKRTKAKSLVKGLIKHFNDTLDIYAALYPPKAPVATATMVRAEPVVPNYGTKFAVPSQPAPRDAMIAFASQYVGTRYKWGGETPAGFDCSGFVLHVFRNYGYDFAHRAAEISKIGENVPLSDMKKGDLAFFGYESSPGSYNIQHIGIIANAAPDNPQVIHATNKGVLIDSLGPDAYWSRKILFVKDIIMDDRSAGRAMYGN